MARSLSSNGCVSGNFDDIHLKMSAHANLEVCFHFILSKYENAKNRVL